MNAGNLFTVVPLTWCPHVELVQSDPGLEWSTKTPCSVCKDPSENWICLTCYQVNIAQHQQFHTFLTFFFRVFYWIGRLWTLRCWSHAPSQRRERSHDGPQFLRLVSVVLRMRCVHRSSGTKQSKTCIFQAHGNHWYLQAFYEAKNRLHVEKFGEPLPIASNRIIIIE